MVKRKWFIYLSVPGLFYLGFQPVNAQSALEAKTTQIKRVKDFPRPIISVQQWLTQVTPIAGIVQITAVKLNPTQDGLQIVLETSGGEPFQGTTTVQKNRLIAEISRAQLQLSDGKEFRQNNPAPGIAAVRVSAIAANTVQVVITGIDGAPEGTILKSQSGLVLSVLPFEPEEELVVTAQKRPESAQNVPISLTAIPRQTLEDAGINSVRKVAANVPNFFATLGQRSFNFQTIRGIGNSNYLVRDAIGFYIDGVPYENVHQYLPGELFDLERVEVLRGPQGTLYGRSSQAGVVNIISRAPTNFPEIQVGGGYGNFNQRRANLSLSDAIIKDQLAFRLSGSYNARDGFTRDTLLGKDADAQSSLFGRANLVWTPSKEWNIAFNANGGSNQDGDATFVLLSQRDPFKVQRNFPGSLDVSLNTQSVRIAYEGAAVNVISTTAHNQTDLTYISDIDYSPIDLLRGESRQPSTIWSQEIRIQSPATADRFRWVIGGYYQSRSLDIRSKTFYTPLAASLFGLPGSGVGRLTGLYDQTTFAGFGQIDFKPIDPLTLTAGLRYETFGDRLSRSNTFESSGLGEVPIGPTVNNSEINGDVVLPRLAVQYRFSPTVMAYGSVARGYKPGSQNYGSDDLTQFVVRPEKTWSYELGVKTNWLDNRFTANVAVFWSDIDDYQLLLPDEFGFAFVSTNGGVRTRGFELELAAKPFQGFEVNAGFGYTNAKFTQYRNPFTGENFRGNRLTYAPDYTLNLGVQYRNSGFFGRVDLQGLGTYFFDDANTIKQPPFALVNARIGYEWKSVGIYFYVDNLFNKEYVTAAFRPPETLASFGDRRTFGFQVQAKF
ncbi:MAG: TonB-dependent receptor [Stenomitos rutilans HA7619-LM2]|jgi:iron complex outermembrane receptor protein|nr:TonB-dependent receptor [Stenomitos rutilans HA7619-LM2]